MILIDKALQSCQVMARALTIENRLSRAFSGYLDDEVIEPLLDRDQLQRLRLVKPRAIQDHDSRLQQNLLQLARTACGDSRQHNGRRYKLESWCDYRPLQQQ